MSCSGKHPRLSFAASRLKQRHDAEIVWQSESCVHDGSSHAGGPLSLPPLLPLLLLPPLLLVLPPLLLLPPAPLAPLLLLLPPAPLLLLPPLLLLEVEPGEELDELHAKTKKKRREAAAGGAARRGRIMRRRWILPARFMEESSAVSRDRHRDAPHPSPLTPPPARPLIRSTSLGTGGGMPQLVDGAHMSIQSIGPTPFTAVTPASAGSAPAAPSVSSPSTAGGRLTLSPRSHFLGKLTSLMSSDPAQAKKLVTDLAAKMRERAANAPGASGTRASALADRLEKAAASGDLMSLFDGGASSGGSAATSAGAGAYAAMATTRTS